MLSAAGLVLLVLHGLKTGSFPKLMSGIVFGSSLLIQYVCSTLLHCSKNEQSMSRLETLDHSAIYLLIAGTYTPYLLVKMNGPLSEIMLSVVWTLALCGIILKLWFPGRFMAFSIIQYIGMSWLLVVLIRPLQITLPVQGITWLLLGLLLYSAGSIFYFWRKLRYHHAVWHLFVLTGSFCHFVSVYNYVLS